MIAKLSFAFARPAASVRAMHRQPLLDQLADYAARHPQEADTVGRFIDFVNAEADCFERSLAIGHVTALATVIALLQVFALGLLLATLRRAPA